MTTDRESRLNTVIDTARNVVAQAAQLSTKHVPGLPICLIDKMYIDSLVEALRLYDMTSGAGVELHTNRRRKLYNPPPQLPPAPDWGTIDGLRKDNASLRSMIEELNKRLDTLTKKGKPE